MRHSLKLILPNGALSSLVFKFNLPGTISEVTHKPLVLTLNIIGQTGTAILLTIIITILMSKKVNFKDAVRLFGVTFKELWLPVLTICFILAISKITTYGGLSAAMGQGIAKAGNVFPVLSPILGWIGVFMTGSVVITIHYLHQFKLLLHNKLEQVVHFLYLLIQLVKWQN